jgi:hypothetical protein
MPISRSVRLGMLLMVALAARPAFAQDTAPVEVAVGYQYLIDLNDDSDVTHYKRGLLASAAWNATRRLALVGEFSRSAMTSDDGGGLQFAPIDRTLYTSMGGVRFWFGGLYVQTLVGQFAVRSQRELLLGSEDRTETELVVQPGVGFNVVRVGRITARVLGDYRRMLSNDTAFAHQFRVGVTAAVGLGGSRTP